MKTQQLADTYQVALPNLTTVSTTILSLLGALFTIWMATKMFHAFAKKDYGAMVIEGMAGVVCAFFVLLPDQAVAMLKAFAVMIFGSGAA